MAFIKSYLAVLVTFAVIDVVWLTLMNGFYRQHLGHLMQPTVNLLPAVLFYLIYTLGITLIVVMPARDASLGEVALRGAMLGLVAYATYDLTNAATLRDWPWTITLLDIAWGTALTTLTATAASAIVRWLG